MLIHCGRFSKMQIGDVAEFAEHSMRIEEARALLEQARQGLQELGPWVAEAPTALACSGGADSTFLALAWKEFSRAHDLPVEIWVVNHGHRAQSSSDASTASGVYRRLGFKVHVLSPDPPDGPATETALRELRYASFADAAEARGIRVLCTAHQADDVAETVFLRILRGTGFGGISGIPARRLLTAGRTQVEMRRPLLKLRREAIRRALRALQQEWHEDPTNDNADCSARNRLRLQLFPALRQVATGDPVKALLRLAQEGQAWKDAQAELLAMDLPWRQWPSYLRQQAIAVELRSLRETVSPERLRNLEEALLRKGSAHINGRKRLSVRKGCLAVVDRADA